MSVALATAILFCLMLIFLALGLPIAFALGGSAVLFGLFTLGAQSLFLMCTSVLNNMRTIILIAVPLFIFMGNMLETSGVAEGAYSTMHKLLGSLRGGLAVATVIVCTLLAACTGVSGAATVTMGLIALPSMLRRGYEKKLAIGCIMAGGALGQLIPPSLIFILYGFMANESVGRLFAGGILPGLLLSGFFIIYVIVMCILKPSVGPAIPLEERAGRKEKLVSLTSLILPLVIIIMVLGSIFSGLATPTESAAIGAFGTILCAAIYRKLNWENLKRAIENTISVSAMVMWIVVGATAFTTIFASAGAGDLIKETLVNMNVSPMVIIFLMQVTLFILGCFLDPSGIILITTPIYVPVIKELGFSPVWFGVLFCVNMEMAYLTPPYGFNLFYMRGIAPPEVTMKDIYWSAAPFVAIQAVTLILIMTFPNIALWIPNVIFGAEL